MICNADPEAAGLAGIEQFFPKDFDKKVPLHTPHTPVPTTTFGLSLGSLGTHCFAFLTGSTSGAIRQNEFTRPDASRNKDHNK